MPKVDFDADPKPEPEEPLHLDFAASRPTGASADEERPLNLDLSALGPLRRRPETTYRGFAQDPAAEPPARRQRHVRGRGAQRGLLLAGVAAVIGLGVAGALWSYPLIERRIMANRDALAAPAPAPSAPAVAQVATVKPPPPLDEGATSAQLDAAPPRAEPTPEAARPARHEPSLRRPPQARSERPGDSDATARANLAEAYAPASTLSAQAATAR